MEAESLRRASFRRFNARRVWNVYVAATSLGVLIVPLASTLYGFSFSLTLLAIILLAVCLYPTAKYLAQNDDGIPVLAVLCLAYAVQFALPVFLGKQEVALTYGETRYLEDSDVAGALILSILGVLTLQFAYSFLRSRRFMRSFPAVNLRLNQKKAVAYCVLVGLLSPLLPSLRAFLSEQASVQLSAIFTLLQNQQLVVVGILGWIVYSGQGRRWHKLLLYAVVAMGAWRGLSSGFLEQAIVPIAVLFVMKWLYGKRLSVLSVAALVLIILFLSPVKALFRQSTWTNPPTPTTIASDLIDKPFLWIGQASQFWVDTYNGERGLAEATSSTTSRTDLIHQFAHISSLTPELIPYQYGSTYSYFTVALIPRALWPDKPQAGGTNSYFAVTYGIATEELVKVTTFGVSLIGEGYINFGTLGVVLIMALQGGTLALLQHAFGSQKSGAGGQAVFLAFFVFFLNGVGTSAEILFGNIVQNLLVSCVLIFWVRAKPSAGRLARARLAGAKMPHAA